MKYLHAGRAAHVNVRTSNNGKRNIHRMTTNLLCITRLLCLILVVAITVVPTQYMHEGLPPRTSYMVLPSSS